MIKVSLVHIIIAAFILDMLIGDPPSLPHPIVYIGRLIGGLEKNLRKLKIDEYIAGVLLAITVIVLCFSLPFFILLAAKTIHPALAIGLETIFCYQILAAKSLKTESMKVFYPLKDGDILGARRALSFIVGRDTEELDQAEIIKATVETIAENTTDGVIAPLFFMVIGGAPLGFMYKSINTMDSMIGYKNKRYINFGRFAARLDDFVNIIPARIAAGLMILAAFVLRLDFRSAVKIYLRDRKNHTSPNAAQTESVCAGALGIQLAGDSLYKGILVKKPSIGNDDKPVEANDIVLSNRLMYVTSILGAITFLLIRSLII